MLDPRLLKENPQAVREMLEKRNMADFPLDSLVGLDRRRRELIVETQELRQKKNVLSEAIAGKKKAKQDTSLELNQMKEISSRLGKAEEEMTKVEEQFRHQIMLLPNMLHESVPVGKDEKGNVIATGAALHAGSILSPRTM
jgi:seryl-tRNA synthetase